MNKDSRNSIENTCNDLKKIKQQLSEAANTVENGMMRNRIQDQVSAIDTCLSECEDIAAGLRQY